ncbi:mpv17-like protein [Amphibalanus amphitrite]|uniref:mpv17-like protein n=1 Tax=Amphibalanus amphitrite TaxID=1232801 RepID=UPI001C927005|nr:mpv17-like protein [Amphibalanus amphitrite]XP_043216982.1 mpv17-like protein [Amphibalanus amphitrite]
MLAVRRLFQQRPLLGNALAYGTLFVGAEFTQQTLLNRVLVRDKEQPKQPYDTATLGRYAVLGYTVNPTILYYWYRWLDKRLVGTAVSTVAKKLVLDLGVIGPINIFIFFTAMALMERKEDLFAEHKEKYIGTCLKQVYFWLPAQAVNFFLLPTRVRVLYVGACSFLWLNLLCWIKRSPSALKDTVSAQKTP